MSDRVPVPGQRRPKLLLVDDHPAVLGTVSRLLARDFEVAAVATSGGQAIDAARRVDPDLIVLDINMPGLDGFQTFRALEETGSRAAVVFLSVFDVDEHVGEAFRCGGHGYVLKSRAARDLPIALRQASLGRRYAPSLTSMCGLTAGGGHAMQVYAGVTTFLDELALVFAHALGRGDAACVIATEDVRSGLALRLGAQGWNVAGPNGHERYVAIDAVDGLNRVMRNGLPDRDLLAGIISALDDDRRRVVANETNRLTIVGNMASTLVADGNCAGALALERLWHEITRNRPFYTLCAYAQSSFGDAASEFRPDLCAEHDIVSHASDV